MIRRLLHRFKIRFSRCAGVSRGAFVARAATIEGNPSSIHLAERTLVEAQATLSTGYGGTIRIGRDSRVLRGAIITTHGGHVALGHHCTVGPYSVLYGHGGLKVGNYVMFAAHTVVIPAEHSFDSLDVPIYEQPICAEGIEIEDDVWLGAGVRVLDGVRIGKGTVVGAGSVVTKSLPAFSVCVGVPARVMSMRAPRTASSVPPQASGTV